MWMVRTECFFGLRIEIFAGKNMEDATDDKKTIKGIDHSNGHHSITSGGMRDWLEHSKTAVFPPRRIFYGICEWNNSL